MNPPTPPSLSDLIAGIADCEADWKKYQDTFDIREGFPPSMSRLEGYQDGFKAGHAACFARLGKALEEAMDRLAYSVCDCYVHEKKHREDCEEFRNDAALDKIHAILSKGAE